jgi:hypothetical protein
MFSAAIVSARTRLSANATSEGTCGFRLCTTMIMSNSSACVLGPNGSVGLVELGSTLPSPVTLRRSGEWPPPAPSLWKVWMVRPSNAAIVSSTNPASFCVSVCTLTCTSIRSATDSAARIAAGWLPSLRGS